jgi:large subunit ribosomal protein L15
MKLSELKPPAGATKKNKRVGCGPGSGHGRYSTRGCKGQKARSGGSIPAWFEGGQMPLQRRVPKRGFVNIFKTQYQVVNLDRLSGFAAGAKVNRGTLLEAGLVRKAGQPVKILGKGGLTVALILTIATNSLWLLTRSSIPITRHSYDVTTALATDIPARLRALPGVLWMLCSELFLRPEIYGLTAFITAGALLTGWRRGNRLMRFSLLLPSLLCIAGLIAVYAARQSYLPSERNVSFSRRIIVFLPALAFAALYVPPRREDEQCADEIESERKPDPISS